MNNLTPQTPFSFLAIKAKKSTNHPCGLAWLDDDFHLRGNNYYVYTCHSCQSQQIKKGIPAKECWNWGGHSW